MRETGARHAEDFEAIVGGVYGEEVSSVRRERARSNLAALKGSERRSLRWKGRGESGGREGREGHSLHCTWQICGHEHLQFVWLLVENKPPRVCSQHRIDESRSA